MKRFFFLNKKYIVSVLQVNLPTTRSSRRAQLWKTPMDKAPRRSSSSWVSLYPVLSLSVVTPRFSGWSTGITQLLPNAINKFDFKLLQIEKKINLLTFTCSSEARMRKHAAPQVKSASPMTKDTRETKQKRSEWRITKMVLAIFLGFVACYLPITIVKVTDVEVHYPGKFNIIMMIKS